MRIAVTVPSVVDRAHESRTRRAPGVRAYSLSDTRAGFGRPCPDLCPGFSPTGSGSDEFGAEVGVASGGDVLTEPDDRGELGRIDAGAAHQGTVDVALRHDACDVAGLHRAAVEDPDLVGAGGPVQ